MIDFARLTGCYQRLVADDVSDFLAGEGEASQDLAIAADVLVYIGDLAPLFAHCARVMKAGGQFAFSTQRGGDADWMLGADLRYAHSGAYLRQLAHAHGFEVALLEEASTRKNAGADVPGLVCVMERL